MDSVNSHENTPAQSWNSVDLVSSSYNSTGQDHQQAQTGNYSNSTSAPRKMTICGTHEYLPPEMLFDEDYTYSVDIFSFGMVIFEVSDSHTRIYSSDLRSTIVLMFVCDLTDSGETASG